MASSKSAISGLDPLKDLLGDVLARIEQLESKVGIAPPMSTSVPKSPTPSKAKLAGKC